jgi:four helix bundle protein
METKTQNYRDLLVWQKGIQLAKVVYVLTDRFPAEEKFGLITQLRRASVSIPSNIAEGQARRATGEFIQFISNAEGSVAEVDTQLILSIELNICRDTEAAVAFGLIAELQKMLNGLRRKLLARD